MTVCPAGALRAALPIMFPVWPGIFPAVWPFRFAFVPPRRLPAFIPACIVALVLPLCTFEAPVLPCAPIDPGPAVRLAGPIGLCPGIFEWGWGDDVCGAALACGVSAGLGGGELFLC